MKNSTYNELCNQLIAGLTEGTELPLDLLDWMYTYRYKLNETTEFELSTRPFLRDLYAIRKWPRSIVVKKGAQLGLTEWMYSLLCNRCSELGHTGLLLFPNDTLMSAFSASRFGASRLGTPEFNDLFIPGNKVGGVSQVKTKRIGKGTLLLRGAKLDKEGTNPGLLSISVDTLCLDELNAMEQPAAVVSLGRKRTLASRSPLEIFASTPTHTGIGVSELYKDSTQHEWHVKCSGSDRHEQTFGIDNIVTRWNELRQPQEWHTDEEGNPKIVCRYCDADIPRGRIRDGRWIPRYKDRERLGYYVHGLLGYPDLSDIIQELRSNDSKVQREAFNQSLGMDFSVVGVALTEEMYEAKKDNYSMAAPSHDGNLFIGIDVGIQLHVVVIGRLGDYTPIVWVGTAKTIDDLKAIYRRFEPTNSVIDANPERRLAEEFVEINDSANYMCIYKPSDKPDEIELNPWKGIVYADRTRSLDLTYGHFFNKVGFLLPADIDNIEPDFMPQLIANKRRIEKNSRGDSVARWVEDGEDHYSHALNMAVIASRIGELGDWDWSKGATSTAMPG